MFFFPFYVSLDLVPIQGKFIVLTPIRGLSVKAPWLPCLPLNVLCFLADMSVLLGREMAAARNAVWTRGLAIPE